MHTETVPETNDIETAAAARSGDTLGYAGVSTPDQCLSAQRIRLLEAGAIRLFTDVASGKRVDRPGLAELIEHARTGDRLCVTRLDCLGRTLRELLEIVDGLKARGIHLVSLEERLDTSSAAGELVFHVFGAIAHFEGRLISERTRDGIAEARRRGRKTRAPATRSRDGFGGTETHRSWSVARSSGKSSGLAGQRLTGSPPRRARDSLRP